jgi:hypothetical protein
VLFDVAFADAEFDENLLLWWGFSMGNPTKSALSGIA